MSLPQFSVRRPVTTVMIYLGIVLLGIIAWTRLPQELFPPITYPQLTVVTHYKDAAPEEIELLVTKPIEEVTGTVSGLRRISSISKEELSLVIAEFNWDTNMDFAALGVREKIDLIKERLPRGAEDPVVIKYNPFELPVLVLNLSGDVHPYELLTIARKQVKNELEKVEGVAAVNISGGLEREILVELDQGRLQSARLPISQIVDSLSKANLNYPAGTIKEAFYEYLIRTMGEFSVVKEIPGIAVGVDEKKEPPEKELEKQQHESLGGPLEKEKGLPPPQRLIMLKDIGVVKDTYRDRESISRFQGKDNISLSIQKQAGVSTLQVVSRVQEAMKGIRASLPPGVQLAVAYDQSTFIRKSIADVRDAALQGGLFAFGVLFLFLGNFWAALNVTFAIPISVFATVGPMYFSGLTINVISMGGLAMAVGMLVDAGTVAVENIDLKRRDGKPSKEAAVEGTEEISSALFGTVNTTVVVFLPMIFVVGIAGQLFKQLAYTVTVSNYASLAVALTLTPLFASRIRYGTGRSPIEPFIDAMRRFDTALVTWFLRHRIVGIGLVTLMFVASLFGLGKLDRELLPRVDQGQFILRVNLNPGTRLDVTDRVTKRIEQVLQALPEVRDATVNIGSSKEKKAEELLETLGSHQAQILVNLWPKYMGWGQAPGTGFRTRKTAEVVQELKDTLSRESLEGANVEYLLQESVFKSALLAGAPVVVEIKGTDLQRVEKIANQVKEDLTNIPGLYGVQTSLIPPSPETKVHVMKDRASTYHLSVSDIALTAQTALKGYVATKFKEEGKEIDIRVRLRKQDREDMSRVRRLLIHSPLDLDVPLAEVAYLSDGKGPTEIRHLDQQRTVLISAQLFNRSLSEVLKEVSSVLDKRALPSGYTAALTGENQQMQESFRSLAFALGLSVLLVYMVMAAEFESLWQPFLIMGTIPMGIIGVFLAQWLTHTPVSVMTLLGVIILGGLVVDDGIVLVDYINLVRAQGVGLEEAVVLASERRLRPILMTSGTTVLGLVPLAFGLGEGVELQGPMAIAVMGGMTVCTFLTLIFLPALYVVADRFFSRFRQLLPLPSSDEPLIPALATSAGLPVSGLPPAIVSTPIPESAITEISSVEPTMRVELPEIPDDYGGEEIPPDRPDFPVLFLTDFLGKPEPPSEPEPPPSEPQPPSEPPGPPLEPEPPSGMGSGGVALELNISQPVTPTEPPDEMVLEQAPDMVPEQPELPAQPQEPPPVEEPPSPVPPEALPPSVGEAAPPPISKMLPLVSAQEPSPPATPGTPIPLNPRQQQLIEYLKVHGQISRKDYAQLIGASIPTAARDLKELVDRGRIKGIGPLAKGRYYVLA